MPTILITGANKGLGLGFATRFAGEGWTVLASCRNPEKATALKALAEKHKGKIRIDALDVLDHRAIEAYGAALKDQAIDVLLNNAGIIGKEPQEIGQTDYEDWDQIVKTNVFGTTKMCETFVGHVAKSERKLIVNLTSGTSSITRKTVGRMPGTKGEYHLYSPSKTMLNMVSRYLAWEYKPMGITVVVLGPGWVQTDMGGAEALFTIDQSMDKCVPLIKSFGLKDAGKFILFDGSEPPW